MGILLALALGFIPMFFYAWLMYWVDRYEKEPKILLGAVFIWGVAVAAGFAFVVNSVLGVGIYLFTGSDIATELGTGSLVAPLVEESIKGIAVLLVYLFFRREFDSVVDGIVYASIVALGFAATENAYYIYAYGYAENGLSGLLGVAFIRVILVGWQHPFYTSFIGIGLAVARLNKNPWVKVGAPFTGWVFAVFTHSLHNTIATLLNNNVGLLAGTLIDWTGWLAMAAFLLWMLAREQHRLAQLLRSEIRSGVITRQQYDTACSAWKQTAARISALMQGKYAQTREFYQLCGELAHKKYQLATLGDEGGNGRIVEELRIKLAQLSTKIE
ncbi:MAG TPA: PrsW family intramembrane metalloprotease [Chloroflexi bacterium]|nr:PrsW family intramembrane metalloprotease [Chloroflexota bacterium]